jgi:cation-transporting ATPase 13A2
MNTKGKILEEYPEIVDYRFLKINRTWFMIFVVLSILSCGVFAIILYWNKNLRHMIYSSAKNVREASKVVFTTNDQENIYCSLRITKCKLFKQDIERNFFTVKLSVHIHFYSQEEERFYSIGREFKRQVFQWIENDPARLEDYVPHSNQDSKDLIAFMGKNIINIDQLNPFIHGVEILLLPLNIYQLILILLFFYFENYVWSIHLAVYLLMQATLKVIDRRIYVKSVNKFSKTEQKVKVLRTSLTNSLIEEEISETHIVVGDILKIENEKVINCDLLILYGECLINQAVLTGESIPVSKESINSLLIQVKKVEEKNILYSGSQCVITKTPEVWGLVIGTGWNTFKGSLLDQIAKDKSKIFKFDSDFLTSSLIMGIAYISITAFLCIYDYYLGRYNFGMEVMRFTRIIGFALQPGLLMAMVIAIYIIQIRLSRNDISVRNGDKLKEAGRVGVVCFDKTGTLTDDKVQICGYLFEKSDIAEFTDFLENVNEANNANIKQISECIGLCNNLHFVDGKIIGDPIDIEMFNKSLFEIKSIISHDTVRQIGEGKNGTNPNKIIRNLQNSNNELIMNEEQNEAITFAKYISLNKKLRMVKLQEDRRQTFKIQLSLKENYEKQEVIDANDMYSVHHFFDFTPERKRFSVITSKNRVLLDQNSNDNKNAPENREYCLFMKGAPEIIKKFCKIDSYSVNYDKKVIEYSSKGYRLIAIAYKTILSSEVMLEANELEKDLTFLGFIVLHNQQKPKTFEVIQTLNSNRIKCIMVTGDNIFTGVNVAMGTGIINKSSRIVIGEILQDKKIRWTQISENENQKLPFVNNNSQISGSKNSEINIALSQRDFAKSYAPKFLDVSIEVVMNNIKNDTSVLAIEGDVFDILLVKYKDDKVLLRKIIEKIKVFGRTRPDQKEIVVNCLKDYYSHKHITVGFVGDGSNDSKALNAAHTGLSISNSNASIAGSFSTTKDDISPILDLLVEGRYSLENLVQIVNISIYTGFMKSLSLVLIYYLGQFETGYDYLLNIFFMLPIYLLASASQSSGKVNPFMPKPGLFDKQNLIQLAILFVLGTVYILFCFYIAVYRSEFKQFDEIHDTLIVKKINNDFFIETKFLQFCFALNYFVVALSLMKGYPFKKPFYDNTWLMLYMFFGFLAILIPLYADYLSYSFEWFMNMYIRNAFFTNEMKMKAFLVSIIFSIAMVTVIKINDYFTFSKSVEKFAKKEELTVKIDK